MFIICDYTIMDQFRLEAISGDVENILFKPPLRWRVTYSSTLREICVSSISTDGDSRTTLANTFLSLLETTKNTSRRQFIVIN